MGLPGGDSQDGVGVGAALLDGQPAHEGIIFGHKEQCWSGDVGDVLFTGPMLVVVLNAVIPVDNNSPALRHAAGHKICFHDGKTAQKMLLKTGKAWECFQGAGGPS